MVEAPAISVSQAAREAEFVKYARAYEATNYGMGENRKAYAVFDLRSLPIRGSYLDVGCGRGELLSLAPGLGFGPVFGTEVVPALLDEPRIRYAEAHCLPFADHSIDVVSLLDVLEHLVPGDDEAACREACRVARHHVLLTANCRESRNHVGDRLHINIRSYQEWDRLLREWCRGVVRRIEPHGRAMSARWRVDLPCA